MVVTAGVTDIAAVVALVLHRYVMPPDAVRVVEPPVQITFWPAIATDGNVFTVTVLLEDALQPFTSVAVTVYVVVVSGVTVMEAVVALVFHK